MKAIRLFGLRNYISENKVVLPIIPNEIKSINVDFSNDVSEDKYNRWQFIFASRDYPISNSFCCIIRYDKLWLNIGSTNLTTNIPISIGKHNITYTNDFDNKVCNITLDDKYTISGTITNYSNHKLELYSCSTYAVNQTFQGTIYKIHIVKTDNSIVDYVPAMYNNKYGFIDESLIGTDITSDKFYAETIKGGLKPFYDFSKITSIQIPEGNVTKIENKDGKILWDSINKLAYGVRWDSVNKATTQCERIGNLELHKTLPIQSRFKVCIHQGKEIQYYCDPNDSRFVDFDNKNNKTTIRKEDFIIDDDKILKSILASSKRADVKDNFPNIKFIDDNADNDYYATFTDSIDDRFTNYRWLYAFVKITYENDSKVRNTVVGRIIYISDNKEFIIELQTDLFDTTIISIELGCSINGYDGEIGVDTGGKFYQWSKDNDGEGNEVWQSLYKCVPYAREIKRHIIGIDRACVLNSAFNNSKWGWIGTLASNTAVNVINYQTNVRGGINNNRFDNYCGKDSFRCQLGKARTNLPLATMRQYSQKTDGGQMLYKQIWEAIVWAYIIEYADFDVKKGYNASLTNEGYHQGGLGAGIQGGTDLNNYNNNEKFVPNDYTLELGNNTGVKARAARQWTVPVSANHYWNSYDTTSRITATRSTNNKTLTITSTKTQTTDWNIYANANIVGGTTTYKITGLTDGQTVVFRREKGNLTITADGTYDVEWGTGNNQRKLYFGKLQTDCNIVIEIVTSPAYNIIQNQVAWTVPHWRGFNVFWYGDIWINVDNMLTKYDSTKQKRIWYYTDDITKFDNNIYSKEHQIEGLGNVNENWLQEIKVNNKGDIVPSKISSYTSYKNSYHWNYIDQSMHTTSAGGRAGKGSQLGLLCLTAGGAVGYAGAAYGFAKMTILDD